MTSHNTPKQEEDEQHQTQMNLLVDASCNSDSVKQSIFMVFHSIMALFAIYLSWKCNGEKFDLVSFLIAIFVPYLYVIYILATKGTCSNNA
jgi:hypothetical protein